MTGKPEETEAAVSPTPLFQPEDPRPIRERVRHSEFLLWEELGRSLVAHLSDLKMYEVEEIYGSDVADVIRRMRAITVS